MHKRTALDPANRRLYSEILRSPPGYVFDVAVGTTYSLDFETALTIPAMLALQAAEARAQLLDTPLALLEGLERLAGRIAIFCEAGRIKAVPKNPSRLTALLEDTITEVLAPGGGAFHPKLWLLRFMPSDGSASEILRLAILSRNLTTDQSWDLSLVLDGGPSDEPDPNEALIALVSALPTLAPRASTPKRSKELVASLVQALGRTRWTRPEGVRKVEFHTNGLGAPSWQPPAGRGMTIISPFVSAEALDRLTQRTLPEEARLVSRAEELSLLPEATLARFGKVLVLDDLAESEDGEDLESDDAPSLSPSPRRGLHAKAFVTERYSSTEITLGSGNATNAALLTGNNVEVFATIVGPTRDLGGMLEQLESDGALGKYLTEYRRTDPPDTSRRDAAEKRLDKVRARIVRTGLRLRCQVGDQGRIALSVSASKALAVPKEIELTLWPLMAGVTNGTQVTHLGPEPQPLFMLPLRDVTRWVGIRLRDVDTGLTNEFSLGASLDGLPEGRDQAILRSMIEDRKAFLKYLQLLLADPDAAAQAFLNATRDDRKINAFGSFAEVPLLESMVKALSDDGRTLDDVERLISRLETSVDENGIYLIPQEFMTLWESFRTVRSTAPRGSRKRAER